MRHMCAKRTRREKKSNARDSHEIPAHYTRQKRAGDETAYKIKENNSSENAVRETEVRQPHAIFNTNI